jgi:hypothetical protein
MSEEFLHFTKKNAIESHIITAIELFFENKSVPSTYVIAAAAWEMMEQTGKALEKYPSKLRIYDSLLKGGMENPKFVMNRAFNKLKHADTDTFEEIFVSEFIYQFIIFACCCDYLKIYDDKIPVPIYFYMSFFLNRNGYCLDDLGFTAAGMFQSNLFRNDLHSLPFNEAIHHGRLCLNNIYRQIEASGTAHWPYRFT